MINDFIRVEEKSFFKKVDYLLILVILALNIIGLINLYSATHGPNSTQVESLFISQIVWILAGWSIFFAVTLMDYLFLNRIAILIYIFNLGAVLFVTFFGKVAYGAQRWIDLGFFRYQPSESMKLALIVLLSRILMNRSPVGKGMGLRELLLPLAAILLPFILVVEQPDLGTAMMLLMIGSSLLLFAKVNRRIIISGLVMLGMALPIAWKWGLRDYQRNRILTFLSPNNDPRGSGYNSIQSKIAVGSGQFFGKGFRQGTQSQLEFLPERHTDFIFSVLSEEHGFVGGFLTISLFCILFGLALRTAANARDKYGVIVTVGVTAYIFWHMFINVGMVIGLLPIVGVPLPLLSYGGSSMLTTMLALGIVSSVSYRRFLF